MHNAFVFLDAAVVDVRIQSGAHPQNGPTQTQVFLAPDVTRLGDCVAWRAALAGGIAATPEYLVARYKTGRAVKLKRVVATNREICIPPGICVVYHFAAAILDFHIARLGSLWKVATQATLFGKVARPHLRNTMVARVTAAEQLSEEFGVESHSIWWFGVVQRS